MVRILRTSQRVADQKISSLRCDLKDPQVTGIGSQPQVSLAQRLREVR